MNNTQYYIEQLENKVQQTIAEAITHGAEDRRLGVLCPTLVCKEFAENSKKKLMEAMQDAITAVERDTAASIVHKIVRLVESDYPEVGGFANKLCGEIEKQYNLFTLTDKEGKL